MVNLKNDFLRAVSLNNLSHVVHQLSNKILQIFEYLPLLPYCISHPLTNNNDNSNINNSNNNNKNN